MGVSPARQAGRAFGSGGEMADAAVIGEARRLVRGASSAVLATQSDGQPFASLVTPATAPDLSPLLWLSTLSEHTRHLLREPRCALIFTGAPAEANPQTAPRVTITGTAERIEDSALKARWLARHPYAAMYAEFGDFALWRIAIGGALYVGGFARAHRIRAADLVPDAAAVAAIAAAEPEIITHVNADHADAVAAIATGLLGGAPGDWRLAACDVDGCDLALGEAVLRLPFDAPVAEADGIRKALILAARAARQGLSK
jgi:heme iron utilization protein